MAGVIPKKSAPRRKQWSINEAQRSSLKRLRSQLASDGCPESQVILAKQLLDHESEFKSEQKENARLGVYWLLKSSDQGNLEATELLKSCLKTGKGISEHNYMDVKACISMSQEEKIVRKAAREVFASLSNGEEYITSNQLQRKILAIDRGQSGSSHSTENRDSDNDDRGINEEIANNYEDSTDSDDEHQDWSQRSEINNQKLTEDHIVSSAITISQGHLPVVNNALCLIEPNLQALDHLPFVYWSILHPILSLQIIYFKLIKYSGSKPIPLPLARTDVQLLAFLIYSLASFENIADFFPTLIFHASFVIMTTTTFQLLQTQRELHDFRLWRGLFICYSNGDLNEQSFETQFIINHTKQYAWFFVGLFIHYLVYSITPNKLECEFAVIACCLMFMTLFGFMPKRKSKTVFDPLVLLSFGINVLARYPYDTDPIVSKGWRYLELNFASFASYVVSNCIEFCISFRVILYGLIPIILFMMAKTQKWRGSYKTVLPHLVTLSWLQYFAFCSHNTTMYGLYRATLALVGSVLFLPLMGLMSVIIPVVAITQWIVTSNVIYTITIFIVLLSICYAVSFVCAKTKYAQYTAIVQVILMLVACFSLIKTFDRSTNISIDVEPTLEWQSFERLCYQKYWEGTENTASAQTRCAELEHTQIFWEGLVVSVNLVSISNNYKFIFDMFPKLISDHLYCLYGKRESVSCHQDDSSQSDCTILQEYPQNKCTLKEYNLYKFVIIVQMTSSFWKFYPEVHLLLSNEFKHFALRVQPYNKLWFKGSLYNNQTAGANGILGSLRTHVKVTEIGCISCSDHELTSVRASENGVFGPNLLYKSYDAFKFVLGAMFNPVLIFN
ncbi:unnamed protein product [Ceutorhynchus assimilis]|uniref:Wolframin n=1 Tax=Ceutorhynchus assimilis TaxID=467358 RepID=A0A9N9QJA4_9CUCU|nr:unnamed protein product [Ceutorhynchus assimilis]